MSDTTLLAGPVGVIGWELDDDAWREARKGGLGGSDISAVLGFSTYNSPWEVWAEKTGVRSWQDEGSEAANLGVELEPWLIAKAARILGVDVVQPAFRTYAHPQHRWRTCSPDGVTADGRLVEAKTAGLQSGFGIPKGWEDGGIPLGYEFQCRWSLHVMDAARIELVGLVAGMGVQRRSIVRDLAIEADMVEQVSDWYAKHIVGGEEPPLAAVDNETLARLYPRPNGEVVDLDDTDAVELWMAYRAARDAEKQAKSAKETAGAGLKKLLGTNEIARVEDRQIAAWSSKKGAVDWPALIADLVEKHGVPAPNPENYRKPATRSLTVKDV
jgi:putative phage-type endonuclease